MRKVIFGLLIGIFTVGWVYGIACADEGIRDEEFYSNEVVYMASFEEEITEEVVEQPTEQPTEETTVEDYTKKISEWVITAVLGLLGTSAVAVAFRTQLKELFRNVGTALASLKDNKDTAETQIKELQKNAQKTIASLENVRKEMLEENKEQFENTQQQIEILTKAIMFIACGMTELVANGTSETISDMLKGNGNEGEEI